MSRLLILIEQIYCRRFIVAELILGIYRAQHIATCILIAFGLLDLHFQFLITGINRLGSLLRHLIEPSCHLITIIVFLISAINLYQDFIFINIFIILLFFITLIFIVILVNIVLIIFIFGTIFFILFIDFFRLLDIVGILLLRKRYRQLLLKPGYGVLCNINHVEQQHDHKKDNHTDITDHLSYKTGYQIAMCSARGSIPGVKAFSYYKGEEYREPDHRHKQHQCPSHESYFVQVHQTYRPHDEQREKQYGSPAETFINKIFSNYRTADTATVGSLGITSLGNISLEYIVVTATRREERHVREAEEHCKSHNQRSEYELHPAVGKKRPCTLNESLYL